uniref:DUF19 domain-containing protein n=1 Tax=Heterorhabditis bacteriophora TaxID=37862 RepID=A0A1I7WSD0_HETBA
MGDVIRTVYCRDQCTVYLRIPENLMPLCSEEHLKMNHCGTVITCDWSEAERDKIRPLANSTDVSCCYRTTIKEKGECREPSEVKTHLIPKTEAAYIIWTSLHHPSHKKIMQTTDYHVQHPAVTIRPLVDTRLLNELRHA